VGGRRSKPPVDRIEALKRAALPASRRTLSDQQFQYDDIGNPRQRTTRLGWGPNMYYEYGQNEAGPHAVTQVTIGEQRPPDVYGYDSGGNQTVRPNNSIVRYKAFNLPSGITTQQGEYSFKYDAARRRVVKRSPNGDTVTYVGGLYEHKAQGPHSWDIFYIPAAGRVVAQVVSGGASPCDQIAYDHVDRLGSTDIVTNPQGEEVGGMGYEPFGQMVNPSQPTIDVTPYDLCGEYRFTGHFEESDLGLIDMIGRTYDPKIGRFLIPDPFIQDPLRSESLNRYSYAWNNPLKWVDPTGRQNSSDAGTSGCWDNWAGDINGIPDAGSFQQGANGPCLRYSSSVRTNTHEVTGFGVQVAHVSGSVTLDSTSDSFYDRTYQLGQVGYESSTDPGHAQAEILAASASLSSGLGVTFLDVSARSAKNTQRVVLGDDIAGVNFEVTVTGPSADLYAGAGLLTKKGDGGVELFTAKAGAGVDLGSIRAAGGVNVLGLFNCSYYVQCQAGLHAKAALGKETSISLGPVGTGITFDWPKTIDPNNSLVTFLKTTPSLVEGAVHSEMSRGFGMPESGLNMLFTGPFMENDATTQTPVPSYSDNGLFLWVQPVPGPF
jgi:RHS repeat-associated protein